MAPPFWFQHFLISRAGSQRADLKQNLKHGPSGSGLGRFEAGRQARSFALSFGRHVRSFDFGYGFRDSHLLLVRALGVGFARWIRDTLTGCVSGASCSHPFGYRFRGDRIPTPPISNHPLYSILLARWVGQNV